MMPLRKPRWALPENMTTPERVFLDRRSFIGGFAGLAAVGAVPSRPALAARPEDPFTPPPERNPNHADAGRAITPESVNTTYNNFYEFGSHKRISNAAEALETDDWTITIDGLVEKPITVDVEKLLARMPLEERIVRHRCVEACSMVVPWIGFPLSALLDEAGPLGSAKYVRFESFEDPGIARGQRQHWYPWPYTEGLTVDEAANPLAFMVVGAYGKVLHKVFGAPIRLHLPWKYGFKSIKSIKRISLVEERPVSFWEEMNSEEYGFWANVNPAVAHPRWSQAEEEIIGTDRVVPTLRFNGYGPEVAHLYKGLEAELGEWLWR